MTTRSARALFGLAGLLLASTPAWAQYYRPYHRDPDRGTDLRVWVGGFFPDGHSTYWEDKFRDFSGKIGDFDAVTGGGDFQFRLDRHSALMLSATYYYGAATQAYRNFTDTSGGRIRHDASLDIGSFTGAYVFHFVGRRGQVDPYVGAGGGLYVWRLRESGDFIDFTTNPRSIFTSNLTSSGTTGGYFFLAGAEFPLTPAVSLFVEGRYSKASDTLGGDFAGFGKLDLSGKSVGGGVSWHLY